MELNFKRKNRTIIIQISGEIDHHTSKECRRQTESALMEMGGRNIIYDFTNVSFMDSSGIGMMIGRYKYLQAFGGRIAIVSANENITKIIQLSGLTGLISLFDTLEDAYFYVEGREHNVV